MVDLSAADWLVRSDLDWQRLVTVGPPGFEAYGRLRYISDPAEPVLTEADVLLPDDHPSDIEQARIVLSALAEYTEVPGQCFYCVWDGHGGPFIHPEVDREPWVVLPHRRYALFAGRLDEIEQWEREFGGGQACPPPAFVWPADHRWCFASDVDPHWAGVGATALAIDSLAQRADVDVVVASVEGAPPRSG